MKHASYLSHLKFDDKLNNTLLARFLRNPRLLILILLLIIVTGVYSFVNLPRRLNPEINIPIVAVSTVLPGANATDVESLVTDPLEDSISGVENVKTYSSSSQDSASIISIEFESGTDSDRARQDVTTAIDSVTLPDDAQDSNVIKFDFENFPVWSFSLTHKDGDVASLSRFADRLREDLEAISSVDQVMISGLEEQEIQVIIDPQALSTYGFNPQVIFNTLARSDKSFPAGTLDTKTLSYSINISPIVKTIDDIRNTKLNIDGVILNLSDIATVTQKSKPAQAQSYAAKDGEEVNQSITFSIFKTKSANIGDSVNDSKAEVERQISKYSDNYSYFITSDVSKDIDEQYSELARDFVLIVILVFIALFIFLGVRQAIVASLSIPLTFLITFTIMNIYGISLSFISLFSFLLVLGLLVDDTIVVVSAMTSYFRSGKFSSFQTGLLVYRDFSVPIFTSTLTTVWAFVPLLLSTGIIGEFIKPIPIVVSATLMGSFFVAMFITVPIMVYILNPHIPMRVKVTVYGAIIAALFALMIFVSGRNFVLIPEIILLTLLLIIIYLLRKIYLSKLNKNIITPAKKYSYYFEHGILSFESLAIRYQMMIKKILNSKKWIRLTIGGVIIFSIFSYILVPLNLVKTEFFPKIEQEEIFVSVELPSGTNTNTSKIEALIVFERLQKIENIEFISLDLGQEAGEFGGSQVTSTNKFLYTIVLKENRDLTSFDVAEDIRVEFNNYSIGKFSVVEQTGGPPAGADIQIKLIGENLLLLDDFADEVQVYLDGASGVINIEKSIESGTSQITFIPDLQILTDNNVTVEQIGFWLRTLASGTEITSVQLVDDNINEKDITFRLSPTSNYVEDINNLYIPTLTGEQLPLLTLGKLRLQSSPTLITREDGKRTVSVTASIEKGFTLSDINKDLEIFADTLNLPSGYEWKTGGVNEENQDSVNSILIAMILSFILIFVTMVLQFSSFRKAVIVLLVIPLSISGVFIVFALTNTPLSFPALIGVLALFGIVVKNSILVVDKISANEKTSMSFIDGIAEGSSSRLEAIALTSVTAILGLIPITLSNPLWRGLGGAIIAGLIFSGTIMLFFIPVVYYLTFKSRQAKKKVT